MLQYELLLVVDTFSVPDVVMDHCSVTGNMPLLHLKLRPDTPQHYEDIHFRNITIKSRGDLISIEGWTQYFDLKGEAAPAQLVENVTMENVTGTAGGFGKIKGPKDATIRDISLKDIDLTAKSSKVTIEKVDGLKVENAKINGEPIASGQ